MLKLYYCRRPASPVPEQMIAALPLWRRERLAPLKNENARRSSVGAGLLWKAVMQKHGISPEKTVSFLPAGKPVFSDESLFFSLSHSGEYCLCAVSDKPVGADVEAPRPAPLSVARYLCADEAAWLNAQPPASQEDALLDLWVKKEAWVKAASRDRILALDEYSVLSPAAPWQFSAPAFPDNCHAAVCGHEICLSAQLLTL